MGDERLQEAFNNWNEISVEQENLLAYRTRLKQVMDEESKVKEAELRVEAALEKGLERGIEMTARNFLGMGMEIETVAKGTGLSIEQVQAIKESIQLL